MPPLTEIVQIDPGTPSEAAAVVRDARRIVVRGGGTKPAPAADPGEGVGGVVLGTSRLRGMVEYEPSEFTFTALAGTPVAEITAALAANGQHLPFEPPLAAAGATIGGTLAAGLSGPGAFRFGGVRDFVLGVSFVDGRGRLLEAGGKVVKNAAGFDVPRLLVGSLGCLGVVAGATFKVFPAPEARTAFRIACASAAGAARVLAALGRSAFEVEALQYWPEARPRRDGGGEVIGWIAGSVDALSARIARMRAALELAVEAIEPAEADGIRRDCLAFGWCGPGMGAVKVPVTPARIPEIEGRLGRSGVRRHYDLGGNLLWIEDAPELAQALAALNLAGMAVTGAPRAGGPWRPAAGFAPVFDRLKAAFDPEGRFPGLNETSRRYAAADSH